MKVFAPGKLVLTGAYAVLHGAPAVVVATSRGAVADGSRSGAPSIEVRAALGADPAPLVDASALFEGDRKLGLGASSAILVASLAVRAAERGADLARPDVRAELFWKARRAHAEAQGGGSGVDVAASVFGGVLRYRKDALPEPVAFPRGLHLSVFACAASARTSELRAHLDRFAARDRIAHDALMRELSAIAERAAHDLAAGAVAPFIDDVRRAAACLGVIGRASGAPIVPPEVDELAARARAEDAAFCVSGAGGGDVVVFFGASPPSDDFVARARALGLAVLDVGIDEKGVRIARATPAEAEAATRAATP